jgi:hypothetical protein
LHFIGERVSGTGLYIRGCQENQIKSRAGGHAASGDPVEQQNGLVVLCRGEMLPVRAEGDSVYDSVEAAYVFQDFAACGIPDEDAVASGCQAASVGFQSRQKITPPAR